jgi:phage FluMu gp28-like protein
LIIDEAAFIEKMDDHWKAMYPTLSTGGNCIAISTVNGIGNWYEETYTKAQDKKKGITKADGNSLASLQLEERSYYLCNGI